MAQNKKVSNIRDYRRGPLHLNIGMIIFGILFIYMVVSLILYMNNKHIVGYEVTRGSLSVPNVYQGIAIRDETTVSCNGTGYINFFAKEGEHVACGDLVYSLDSSGKIAEMITSQEEETLLSDQDLAEIRNQAIVFQKSFSKMNFEKVYRFKNQLEGTALKLSNYNMLNNLSQAGTTDAVAFSYAPKSGVVVYGIDGYEMLKPSAVTKDCFDESKYTAVQLEANQLVSQADTAYKLLDNENWSIVIPVDAARAAELEAEEYVNVKFLKNQYTSWAKVTVLKNTDGTYVQLDFTNSMITFATERYIDLEILYNREEGLKIPNSAIVEKEFYMIPQDYQVEGSGSKKGGFLKEVYDENGKQSTQYIDATIYAADDEYYYVDTTDFNIGDYICREGQQEKYAISKMGSLVGVYNMNKGYADFTAITVLYSNEEYSIVKSNTQYGLSEYDFIVLDAASVNPDDFIYE